MCVSKTSASKQSSPDAERAREAMAPDNMPRARPKLPEAGACTSFTGNQVCV